MVTDNKLYKVAITVDGNYVHGKYYDTLTQVYYAEEDGGDGCSYISVKPNQNVIPGTDDTVWKRSSRSGKGEKGDKGDPGERGPQGEPGEIDEQQLQEIENQIAAKQDVLVSGTNIKTVNNQSILGPGNIDAGGSVTVDSALSSTSTNPVQNRVINAALAGKQATLVSGENIATINNQSLLEGGNITVGGGGGDVTVDSSLSSTSTNPVQNKVITSALDGKQATLVGSGTGQNIKTINNQNILGSGNIDAGSLVTIDSSLSTTSTNPVQNKVITSALGGKQDTISDLSTIRSGAAAGATAVQPSALSAKQDVLVSGTNIKTINGSSVLGSGNITIQVEDTDAVKYVSQTLTTEQKTQARTNIGAASLADINNTEYVTVTTLPTASAATVGPIYLVGPDANNNYDRYFTQESGGAYSWVSLGSTQIVLSTYATQDELIQLQQNIVEGYYSDETLIADSKRTTQGVGVFEGVLKYSDFLESPLDFSKATKRAGYVNLDGSFTARSTYSTYNFQASGIIGVLVKSTTYSDTLVISFLDGDGELIADKSIVGKSVFVPGVVADIEPSFSWVPENAEIVQVCFYNREETDVQLITEKTYQKDIEHINEEIEDIKEQISPLEVVADVDDSFIQYSYRFRTDGTVVSSQAAKTYYFHLEDGYKRLVATFNNDLSGYIAICFMKNDGELDFENAVPAVIGEHKYEVDLPQSGYKQFFVSVPDTDVQPDAPDIKVYANKGGGGDIPSGDYIQNSAVLLKDRFGYDETYSGFIRHSGDGNLVSSSGSLTLKFKNQGFDKIEVDALNTHPSAADDTPASYNVISFYGCDQWCGGQDYMQEYSVTAIYNQAPKHYVANVPHGCGIILVTFNNPIESSAKVSLYRGNKQISLDTLESLTDVRLELPSYCTEDYLREKKNLIETRVKANASDSDLFIFMTDEHWERGSGNSMSMVRWLYDHCNIPRLFSGGDTGHEGINMDFIKIRRKAFGGKIYQTIGNHEYLSYTFNTDGNTTEDEVFYGLEMEYGNEVKFGDRRRHYYYVDNDIQKIRYVVLSAFAQGNGSVNSATIGFEQAQCEWLTNTALVVENGWSIIIFTHRLYEGSPATSETIYIPEGCSPVADIIENYSGNGKIIAVFQGHTHFDRIKYLKNGAIPVIITTSDHNGSYRWSEEDDEYIRDYDVTRESGTINEHAFDVVTVDKTLKRISLVRIGCPARDGETAGGELVGERIVYWQ